jgi:hypothetical protein
MPADPLTAARHAWNEDRWADTVRLLLAADAVYGAWV